MPIRSDDLKGARFRVQGLVFLCRRLGAVLHDLGPTRPKGLF